MGPLRISCIASVVAAAAAAACGSFAGDEPSGGVEPDSGADAGDAGDVPDVPDGASSDASDGGGKVDALAPGTVLFEDFESTVLGACGQRWVSVSGATMERVALGRDGGSACRICQPAVVGYTGIAVLIPDAAAVNHFAEAWVRIDPATDAGAAPMGGLFRATPVSPDSGAQVSHFGSIVSGWTPFQLNVLPTESTPLTIEILGAIENGGCFLVDDIKVVR